MNRILFSNFYSSSFSVKSNQLLNEKRTNFLSVDDENATFCDWIINFIAFLLFSQQRYVQGVSRFLARFLTLVNNEISRILKNFKVNLFLTFGPLPEYVKKFFCKNPNFTLVPPDVNFELFYDCSVLLFLVWFLWITMRIYA